MDLRGIEPRCSDLKPWRRDHPVGPFWTMVEVEGLAPSAVWMTNRLPLLLPPPRSVDASAHAGASLFKGIVTHIAASSVGWLLVY